MEVIAKEYTFKGLLEEAKRNKAKRKHEDGADQGSAPEPKVPKAKAKGKAKAKSKAAAKGKPQPQADS